MRENLRIPVTKFRFWIIWIYFLTATSTNYRHRVEAYDFLDQPGVFKFIVAIKTESGICTGTIVNQDWVLTAAHCLYYDGDVVADDAVTVMAGITNYEYPQEDTGQMRSSAEIKVHPRFWYGRLAKFDLALVRVNESFQFNDNVAKIEIAGDGWPTHDEVTDNCMSIGYGGYFGDKSPVKCLKIWNVTAAYGPTNCPCTRRFQYKRLVCAKNIDYAKLCKGDDGGPLVCGNVVRGVAHMIRNWYVCREDPMYPLTNCVGSPDRGLSIYMLLCPFNDWMHGIVSDIPPTPATCGASAVSVFTTAFVFLFIFHSISDRM